MQNELTYEDFLRQLLESRSDKSYMWRQQLERIPGENLDPVVESPTQLSSGTSSESSQEGDVPSELGAA
jgi:hypothetical protein